MIPSLSDLQRLFPIGPIELDAQARRELTSLVTARSLFVAIRQREADETVYSFVNERVSQRFSERPPSGIHSSHVAQVEELAGVMDIADSSSPGEDFAATQDLISMMRMLLAHIDAEPEAKGVFDAMKETTLSVLFRLLAAATITTIHGLMRNVVIASMYRRHPEVRFPIQHLVHLVVDTTPTNGTISATINGYAIDILHDIKSDTKFKAPDTAEEFLRGHSDKGADNASNPT